MCKNNIDRFNCIIIVSFFLLLYLYSWKKPFFINFYLSIMKLTLISAVAKQLMDMWLEYLMNFNLFLSRWFWDILWFSFKICVLYCIYTTVYFCCNDIKLLFIFIANVKNAKIKWNIGLVNKPFNQSTVVNARNILR